MSSPVRGRGGDPPTRRAVAHAAGPGSLHDCPGPVGRGCSRRAGIRSRHEALIATVAAAPAAVFRGRWRFGVTAGDRASELSCHPPLTEFPAGANGDIKPLATIGGGSWGLNGPHGLSLDGAGNLLVANPSGDTVTEYAPGDNPNATPLRTISGLALPDGVDVDAEGNIYVANG